MPNPFWIDAAPFRAHLTHVCAGTGLPWPVVALHARLPLGLARQLLDTRPGRQVHRIAPEFGRQVIAIDEASLRELRTASRPPGASRRAARRLVGRGLPPVALARYLHVSLGELGALLSGTTREVPAVLELQLRSLVALSEEGGQAPARQPLRAA